MTKSNELPGRLTCDVTIGAVDTKDFDFRGATFFDTDSREKYERIQVNQNKKDR